MYFVLQQLVFPKINLCTEEFLYYRGAKAIYNYETTNLFIPKGCTVKFNTFFNSFSIYKWKKYTSLKTLFMSVDAFGSGNILIKHVMHGVTRTIKHVPVESSLEDNVNIEIDISNMMFGYIYVEWQSHQDSLLNSLYFYTMDDVKKSTMAIIITTFNRPQAITKTIDRINHELINDDLFKDRFKLIVVNNGSDFGYKSGDNISIIENENLGGSGGFMRGLIEAQNHGDVKHIVFMDDDGSCEIDSIIRTHSFLSLSKDTNTVVSACMMFEDRPAIIHESGAIWQKDFLHYPDKHGVDARKRNIIDIYDAEKKIGYGGWWFLALNVESIEHYSFPFFVRGDDLLFGYMHKKHNIVTLNGVASWQMDFERKISVLNNYLNFRTIAVPALISNKKYASLGLSLFFIREVLHVCLACRYELGAALIMSYNDCLKGMDFWVGNADCIDIRKKIKNITSREMYMDNPLINSCVDSLSTRKESKVYKIFRAMTLNGHLIPSIFFYKDPIVVDYRLRHPTLLSFMRSKIYHLNIDNGSSIELIHSKTAFFKILTLACFALVKNSLKLHRARKEMKVNLQYLTSREFWLEKFNKHG